MEKTNTVRVEGVHRRDVAAAAHWLLNEFDPADFVSLITDTPEYRAELTANAQALGKLFQKMARRKRSGDEFEARIPRDLARWFGGLPVTPIRWHRRNLAVACHAAASGRAGPKRLNPVHALNRAARGSDNERHKRRLRATIRRDREFDELMQRLGDSIIGGASENLRN